MIIEPILDARAVSIQEGLIHFQGSLHSGGVFYFDMPGLEELVQSHLSQLIPHSREILNASFLKTKLESSKVNCVVTQFRGVYSEVDYPSYPVGMRFQVSEGIILDAYRGSPGVSPSHTEHDGVVSFLDCAEDSRYVDAPCFLGEKYYTGWWYAFFGKHCVSQTLFLDGLIWYQCESDACGRMQSLTLNVEGCCVNWEWFDDRKAMHIRRWKSFRDGFIDGRFIVVFGSDEGVRFYELSGFWSDVEFDRIQKAILFEIPLNPWRGNGMKLDQKEVFLAGDFLVEERLGLLSKCDGFDSIECLVLFVSMENPLELIAMLKDTRIARVVFENTVSEEDSKIYRQALGERFSVLYPRSGGPQYS